MSRRGSCASTWGTRLGIFPTSLYVGMTTSARSPMPGPMGEEHGGNQGEEQRGQGSEAQLPACLIQVRAEHEVYDLGSCRECHRDQRIVPPQHLGRPAV